MGTERCVNCSEIATRDEIGLVMKYFGTYCEERYCKSCLAKKLGCTTELLDETVAYFKSIECPLFY